MGSQWAAEPHEAQVDAADQDPASASLRRDSLQAQGQQLLPAQRGSASPSPSLHVLGSDGLKPSFPASHFHPGCFCISPEEPLHSRFPVTPSHHPNAAMHSNSSPWEASTPLPARTSPSLWPLSLSSPRDRWCLCRVLVPRLPAQEAALFGGTLNPLGFNLLFSTL